MFFHEHLNTCKSLCKAREETLDLPISPCINYVFDFDRFLIKTKNLKSLSYLNEQNKHSIYVVVSKVGQNQYAVH